MSRRTDVALKVLRVLSWPYNVPPLCWLVAFVDWCAATNRRLAITVTLSVVTVAGAIAFYAAGIR